MNEASSNRSHRLRQAGKDVGSAPSVDEHIGACIRDRRRSLNLTQDDLAGRVGVTAQQIHKYESGSNRVAASKLFEIATVLGVPVGAFFEDLHEAEGGEAPDERVEDRRLLDKALRDLTKTFDEIEEGRMRRVVLRIIKAAAQAQKDEE